MRILFSPKLWINAGKIFMLMFVGVMILIQIPELAYDFSRQEPIQIDSAESLAEADIKGATFTAVKGIPDFTRAFTYHRYGLAYTYFMVEPYGRKLVVRTYETIDEDWSKRTRFLGKMRPFDDQPFSYRIRDLYLERFQIVIPHDACFLGLMDVPKPSGWSIGAVIFASVMWLTMFYFFYIFRFRKSR